MFCFKPQCPVLRKSSRDDLVNEMLPFRLGLTLALAVAFPQVEQQTEGHQPEFLRGQMQHRHAEIQKPGEQLVVCYPACVFFPSSSLCTSRFVPRYMASVMAAL